MLFKYCVYHWLKVKRATESIFVIYIYKLIFLTRNNFILLNYQNSVASIYHIHIECNSRRCWPSISTTYINGLHSYFVYKYMYVCYSTLLKKIIFIYLLEPTRRSFFFFVFWLVTALCTTVDSLALLVFLSYILICALILLLKYALR